MTRWWLLALTLGCAGSDVEAPSAEAPLSSPATTSEADFDPDAHLGAVLGPSRPHAGRWIVGGPGAGERAPHQSLSVSPAGQVAWATRDGRVRWLGADGAVRLDVAGPEGCKPPVGCPWLVVGFVDEETLLVVRHGPAVPEPIWERWTTAGAQQSKPVAQLPVARWTGQPYALALAPEQHEGRNRLLLDVEGRAWRFDDPDPERKLDAWAVHGGRVAWSDWEGSLWIDELGEPAFDPAKRTLLTQEKRSLQGRVRDLSWSPDGSRLLVADDLGTLQLFDGTGARLQGSLWPVPPESIAVVDAGRAILTSSGGVTCLDLATWTSVGALPSKPGRPRLVQLAGERAIVPTLGVEGLLAVDVGTLCAP